MFTVFLQFSKDRARAVCSCCKMQGDVHILRHGQYCFVDRIWSVVGSLEGLNSVLVIVLD